MVRVPGKDREGAVELLGQNNESEFVREGDGAEREAVTGSLPKLRRPAVRGTHGEGEFLRAVIAKAAEPGSEGRGREGLAATGV